MCIRDRDEAGIPYQEFYKVIEFGSELDEDACNHLEEALLKMGILDAIVVDLSLIHIFRYCMYRIGGRLRNWNASFNGVTVGIPPLQLSLIHI